MTDVSYPDHAQHAFDLLAKSIDRQFDHLLERGFLGEDPEPSLTRATRFETGCLHLFELDHQLRRGRQEDGFLNALCRDLAVWLLETLSPDLDVREFATSLGWRLGRYQDVTAGVESDETYGDRYASVREEDYFVMLARQYLLCVNADANRGGEHGVYFGVVAEDLFEDPADRRGAVDSTRRVTDLLFEDLLPLHYIASLWAQDGPFYEKPVTELGALAEEGMREAADRSAARDRERFDLACLGRWQHYHQDNRRFVLSLRPPHFPGEPWNERLPVENDALGRAYLRVALVEAAGEPGDLAPPPPGAEEGEYPLRPLLALAHDIGVGLITADIIRRSDRAALDDVPLSLGRVISLLRSGDALGASGPAPDLSDPDALAFAPPTSWEVSGSVLVCLYAFYERSEETIRADVGDDYVGPRIAWVTDRDGASAFVVAPVNDTVLDYLTWLLPSGTVAACEERPFLARFPLDLADEDGSEEIEMEPPFPPLTAEVCDHVAAAAVFHRTGQVGFGSTGEPYEILQESDADADEDIDDASRPLLDFALPCYELGRGMALRSRDGDLLAVLSLGAVITLLREGAPAPPRSLRPPQDIRFDLDQHLPIPPDRITLPAVAERGIAWSLQHAGVPSPRTSLTVTDTGVPTLCFGPPPTSPELSQWVRWRIAWYLPPDSPRITITDHPALIPFAMEGV